VLNIKTNKNNCISNIYKLLKLKTVEVNEEKKLLLEYLVFLFVLLNLKSTRI